jgi:ribosomal protein L9
MRVEFVKEWRGSQPGDVEDIADNFARYDLIPRGIAKQVEEPATKEVKAAPKDKAVKGATKTK